MDLRTLLAAVRTRWKIVAGALAACLIGAAAITVTTPKVYEASASFFISMSGVSSVNERWEGTQVAQFRLSSYAQIAASREVAQRAIDQLGLDLDAQTVADSVIVSYEPEAVIFDMTVSAGDADQVVALADEIAAQFVALVPTLEISAARPAEGIGRGFDAGPVWASATVIDQPVRPVAPVAPDRNLNLAFGLIAGILLGVLLALVREKTDHKVRNAARVEQAYGEQPIAVLEAVTTQRGPDIEFGGSTKANAQYRALRARLLSGLATGSSSIYVTSAVAAPTKSVVAVDTAAALAGLGASVVLVPADPDSIALSILGLNRTPNKHELSNSRALPQGLDSLPGLLAETAYPGLRVVTGDVNLVGSGFHRLLAQLTPECDYIVVEGTAVLPDLDAGLQARHCGKTLLLIGPDDRLSDLGQAVTGLETAGVTLIGVALAAPSRQGARNSDRPAAVPDQDARAAHDDVDTKQTAHAGD